MNDILSKKPQEICKEILELIDNKDVKVEVNSDEKSSLYVFLNNTIYISGNEKKSKDKEKSESSKLLVMAHECRHSTQDKVFQMLNFALSNLEIVLFVALLVMKVIFKLNLKYVAFLYFLIVSCSIFIRLFLELDAVINSVKIVTKYLFRNNVDKVEIEKLQKYYKKEIIKTLPLFILWLFLFKIIRLMIIVGIV